MATYFIRARNAQQHKDIISFLVECKGLLLGSTTMTPAIYLSKWPTYYITRFTTETKYVSGYQVGDWKEMKSGAIALTLNQFKVLYARLNKPFVKSEPAFMLGFEIEGCVHPDCRDELTSFLMDMYNVRYEDQIIHYDGSIRPKCRSIEIVTPPLPIDEAIDKLEWLFGTLSIMSDEGLFETNSTCGFHVNLSERDSFSHPMADTRNRFTYEFMKRVDPDKWRRQWRRTANKYCWWAGHPKDVDDIHCFGHVKKMARRLGETMQKTRHWAAINTTHLDARHEGARRVEVRVAGGANYHVKSDKIASFLVDIQEAMKQAYDNI